MFCPRCGTANPDQAKYCAGCGDSLAAGTVSGAAASIPSTAAAQPVIGKPPTSGKAIASLVCGIFGFFLGSIAAVILGHMAHSEIRKSAGRIGGQGIATTGLVLGYLGLMVLPIMIIAAIAIPNLLRARIAANEASAVGSLRTIETAAISYGSEYENGFPSSLDVLGGSPGSEATCNRANLIGAPLASGRKTGYEFTYTPVFPDNR